MTQPVSTSTDKNIVDLSRGSRNRAVNRAIKATREKLQYGDRAIHTFDRDLLVMHLAAVLQSASITPYMIIVITFIGTYFNDDLRLIAWAFAALFLHAVNTLIQRFTQRQHITQENVAKWRHVLLLSLIHI